MVLLESARRSGPPEEGAAELLDASGPQGLRAARATQRVSRSRTCTEPRRSLRGEADLPSSVRYTTAKEWKDVIKEAYQYRHRSELDPVLSLQQAGKPKVKLPSSNVIKLVSFTDWDDLGLKLRTWAHTPEAEIPAVIAKLRGSDANTTGSAVSKTKSTARTPRPTSTSERASDRPTQVSAPAIPAAADAEVPASVQSDEPSIPPAQVTVAEKLVVRYQARQRRIKETGALARAEFDRRSRLIEFIPTAKEILANSATRTAEQRKADLLYAKLLAGPFSHLFHVLKTCAVIVPKGKVRARLHVLSVSMEI